jgi:membrane dipeptidase
MMPHSKRHKHIGLIRLTIPLLLGFVLFTSVQAQEASSQKIHRGAVLIDTHNDFPSASIEKGISLDQDLKGRAHTDLGRLQNGGVDVQVFSIFCDGTQENPYQWANREIDSVQAWVIRNADRMMLVRNSTGLKHSLRGKKTGAMLGVEGGHMIENKLENLENLFKRGVRYMTLTWNNSTPWASSAWDETLRPDSLSQLGLTEFGKSVVRKMNELGMIVDVSHLGEKSFWDVMQTSSKPVIASHSCVKSLCPHRRNLTDDQIRAIAKNGGVVHLNFYAGFLDSSFERKRDAFLAAHQPEVDALIAQRIQRDYAQMMVLEKYPEQMASILPPLSLLIDHLDHFVRLVGVNHVGLGSDFDGIEAPPLGLNGVEDFPKITSELISRGYSRRDIRKILGGNFIRVLKANERNGK